MKARTGLIKNCLVCNNSFYIAKNRINTALYCSRLCKDKNAAVKITANCQICNKQFDHISSRCNKAKYCSRLCYHRSQIGRGTKEFTCLGCNIIFLSSPSRERKYCSISCLGLSKRINIDQLRIGSLRKTMVNRGMLNKCNRCDFSAEPRILGVHHIDRNRGNNDSTNLEILCPNCHSLEHLKHIPHGYQQ